MYVRFLRLLRPPEKSLVNLTKGPYTAFKSPATLIRKCQNIHSYSRLKCKCRMSRLIRRAKFHSARGIL